MAKQRTKERTREVGGGGKISVGFLGRETNPLRQGEGRAVAG